MDNWRGATYSSGPRKDSRLADTGSNKEGKQQEIDLQSEKQPVLKIGGACVRV